MENRRMKNTLLKNNSERPYKILWALHKLDFDNVDNEILTCGLVESDQEDIGLAVHEVKELVKTINKQIDNNYFYSVHGVYHGDDKTKYYHHISECGPHEAIRIIEEVTA